MIDVQQTWRRKYDEDLLDIGDSATDNPNIYSGAWADYMRDRIDALTGSAEDGIGTIIQGTIVTSPRLTFARSVLFSRLLPLLSTGSPTIGARQFANAWGAAWRASTLLYLPGDSVGAPSPPTTWSVVTSLIIQGTIGLSEAFLIANLPLQLDVSTRRESRWPILFRDSISLIQGTATGLNSVPPLAGPNPLSITGPLA